MRVFAIILFFGLVLGGGSGLARAQDYPTNLLHLHLGDFTQRTNLVVLGTNGFPEVSLTNVRPLIHIESSPMSAVILMLSEQGGVNYLIDPHYRRALLGGGAQHPGDRMVDLILKNITIEDAFTALLKPRGFVMLDEPVSGIPMITRYSHRPYVLDGTLLHMETNPVSGTNGIFYPVDMFNERVDVALKRLITASGLDIKLDRAVINDVNWAICMRAERTTAKQALYAICQACEFEIVKDDDGQVVIRPMPVKYYHHVPIH